MLTIKMFCSCGMSTYLLGNRMKQAADELNEEIQVYSFPVSELDRQMKECDVILLGPQVGYLKTRAKRSAAAAGIPLEVISMQDYGMCDGAKVLEQAKRMMNE